MQILQFQEKVIHLNAVENFYIYKEASTNNHLNDTPQFPIAKFPRQFSKFSKTKADIIQPIPSHYLLPWPTAHDLWSHAPSQHTVFLQPQQVKHGVVYTTWDTATIHIPKCPLSKITGALIGTDTTATERE